MVQNMRNLKIKSGVKINFIPADDLLSNRQVIKHNLDSPSFNKVAILWLNTVKKLDVLNVRKQTTWLIFGMFSKLNNHSDESIISTDEAKTTDSD
jgi:hypothetical protein